MKCSGIQVLFAASEMAPYAYTGGLGDVIGSLPAALAGLGAEVSVVLPYYRRVRQSGLAVSVIEGEYSAPVGGSGLGYRLLEARTDGVRLLFIDRPEFFDRDGLYLDDSGSEWADNAWRYTFFSRAVIDLALSMDPRPRIIHCHDWQTGLVPAYLSTVFSLDRRFENTASVFTIHNIGYQGIVPKEFLPLTGLDWSEFTPEGLEFYDRISFLKSGLVYCDALTTVSSKYSEEIQTPEFGFGLDGVVQAHKQKLHGILNGADYTRWDPSTDKSLPANYGPDSLAGKAACRKALVDEFGLKPGRPVIGMVTRLAAQKGIDILLGALDRIMALDINLVLLGQGAPELESSLRSQAGRFEGSLGVKIAFDERLSRLIEAGSDFFLMPSRYEPSGLNQIYSLRYGTVPIVRATGGLDDTILDVDDSPAAGNGFKFLPYTADALADCVERAVRFHRERPVEWKKLLERAMREDYSWPRSAERYLEVYCWASARRGGSKVT